MQVQIRHDENVRGDKNGWIEDTVKGALERYGEQITTVEVHLADEDGPKNSDGAIRCSLEVRAAGFKPMAATAHANDVGTALEAALGKIERHLESLLGRVRNVHSNPL
ncbi:MAG: HPF/RaiA family ribosome-associated protein [Deltaproteobacteria bacterium]|nr:HPF/RaiA family ribosome-associated protein [Deltaproteobacteria bacterium]